MPPEPLPGRSFTRDDFRPAALLIALPLVLLAPAIATGQIPFFMDTVTQFFPIKLYAARVLWSGDIPLWNPTFYAGTPLLANPQWGVLYPGQWIFFLFPGARTFTLVTALHVALGGLGAYALAKSVTGNRAAALLAGLLYEVGGWVWGHWAFGAYLLAQAYVPWSWWAFEAYRQKRRARDLWVGSVVVGLSFLTGAPQIAAHGLTGLWLLGFVRGAADALGERSFVALRRALAALVVMTALGLMLSAIQTIPTYYCLDASGRGGGLGLDEIRAGSLSLADLGKAMWGGTGNPEDAETSIYLGLTPLFLLLLALRPSSFWRNSPYAILLLFSLLYCLRPLASVWFDLFPPYRFFHDPRRMMAVGWLAAIMLAASGFDSIFGNSRRDSAA
ncbi:MAG: hypothetical protein V2A74_05595, partial [bacterium]